MIGFEDSASTGDNGGAAVDVDESSGLYWVLLDAACIPHELSKRQARTMRRRLSRYSRFEQLRGMNIAARAVET